MKTENYNISGMHCAACSATIERKLNKLEAVEKAEVNLLLKKLNISYDADVLSREDIVKIIEKAGFGAELIKEEKVEASESKMQDKPDIEGAHDFQSHDIAEAAKLKSKKLRLIFALAISAVLMIFSMGQMMIEGFPVPEIFSVHKHPVNFAVVQLILTMLVIFMEFDYFKNGILSLFRLSPNMDSLVSLSSGASLIYSLVMTFLIDTNPHHVHNLYYESSAMVIALVSLGKYMEEGVKSRTTKQLEKLIQLSPDKAVKLVGDKEVEVKTQDLALGDIVIVKAGSKIPQDGIIFDGAGNINEAMLTGEMLPVYKTVGGEVTGGSILTSGVLKIEISRVGKDSTLAKIIDFIESAQLNKAPISRLADIIAGRFVPVVIAISTLAAIVWTILGQDIGFSLKIFTSVLVIACPCALGLATPTAVIVSTGKAASMGILIRGGAQLEMASKIDTVIFDKTGTLTKGKPKLTDFVTAENENREKIFKIIYSLEKLVHHPVAEAVIAYGEEKNLTEQLEITDFNIIEGSGVSAKYTGGESFVLAKPNYFENSGIDLKIFSDRIRKFENQGKGISVLSVDHIPRAVIAISDELKPQAVSTIKELKEMGIETVMLTGDNEFAAKEAAKKLGIDDVISNVLPIDKAKHVEAYKKNGRIVMMIGDGINDAPALEIADLSMSLSSASDIAIDSADIVLIKDDISLAAKSLKIGRLGMRGIKQNLFWAFFYNVISIPVAAGLLYSYGILLSPMIGAVAMSMSSLFVVTNALRLKNMKL